MIYFSLAFIVAASVGAFLRFQTEQWVVAPWGILLVNVIGSLAMGFLAVSLSSHSPQLRAVVFAALLGSLTTFSGYSLQLVQMFDDGNSQKAFLYLISSNALCFGACFLGWKIAQNMMINS